jgi:phage terminase Nu1 subunit (DNA packaging protein)
MSGKSRAGRIVNRAELAAICGVSLPTIDAWVDKGCPFVDRGSKGREWRFDTAAVLQWRIARSVEDAISGYEDDSGNVSREEADRRRALATAITAEVAADEALDVVVRRHDVQADVAAFCLVLKSGLSNAASKIASRSASIASAPEIEELCQSEFNRALGAARGELAKRWADEPGDAGPSDHGEDQ